MSVKESVAPHLATQIHQGHTHSHPHTHTDMGRYPTTGQDSTKTGTQDSTTLPEVSVGTGTWPYLPNLLLIYSFVFSNGFFLHISYVISMFPCCYFLRRYFVSHSAVYTNNQKIRCTTDPHEEY